MSLVPAPAAGLLEGPRGMLLLSLLVVWLFLFFEVVDPIDE